MRFKPEEALKQLHLKAAFSQQSRSQEHLLGLWTESLGHTEAEEVLAGKNYRKRLRSEEKLASQALRWAGPGALPPCSLSRGERRGENIIPGVRGEVRELERPREEAISRVWQPRLRARGAEGPEPSTGQSSPWLGGEERSWGGEQRGRQARGPGEGKESRSLWLLLRLLTWGLSLVKTCLSPKPYTPGP